MCTVNYEKLLQNRRMDVRARARGVIFRVSIRVEVFHRFRYITMKSPPARAMSIFLFTLAVSQRQRAFCLLRRTAHDYGRIPGYACAPRDPEAF